MSGERLVVIQFCDDIRQEIGNKISLMGCYGPGMIVADFPVVLPKLCVQVKVYSPIDRPFSRLVIRVLREDRIVAELPLASDALKAAESSPVKPEALWRICITHMVMSPFPVEEPFRLRVEVETEEGTLSGGSFWIDRADAGQAA